MANDAACHQVDIYRRSDFVGKIKEDGSTLGCLYIGQTADHNAVDTDECWQIRRITFVGGVLCTEYAANGKYNQKWADRAAIFPPCPPGAAPIPGQTETNVVTAPPTVKWIEIAAADTEQSYTMPANTKRFEILNDGGFQVRLAYATGKAAIQAPITNNEYWPPSTRPRSMAKRSLQAPSQFSWNLRLLASWL